MSGTGTGAGLAALGFWLFIATLIVVLVWATTRRRQMQQELLQRLLESGQKIDPQILDRIFPPRGSGGVGAWVLIVLAFFIAMIAISGSFAPGGHVSYALLALALFAFLFGVYAWMRTDRDARRASSRRDTDGGSS